MGEAVEGDLQADESVPNHQRKHGRIIWDVLVGCILRDIFPEPEAVLYLTGATQREFVSEFNTLLVEALAGTEIQMDPLSSAQSREDVARCISYRMATGAISPRLLSRVEVLIRLFSPLADHQLWGVPLPEACSSRDIKKV